jgi:pimeloyl-ACP methyl ester carboxylesterase
MLILLSLLALLFVASFLVTWAGFALALVDRGERWHINADDISLYIREWTQRVVLWLLKPLGWRQNEAADFVPGGIEGPVLLVPDRGLNRYSLWPLQAYLQSRGFSWTARLNLHPAKGDIPALAKRLSDRIDQICRQTHAERVDLVGHGAGGVVCAWMLANGPSPERVRSMVTIGTPWAGTQTWPLSRENDLAPGNEVIVALDATLCPITSLWSRTSPRVIPGRSAAPSPSERVEVTQMGHLDFLFSARTFELVANALRNPPKPEVDTLEAGGSLDV